MRYILPEHLDDLCMQFLTATRFLLDGDGMRRSLDLTKTAFSSADEVRSLCLNALSSIAGEEISIKKK